MDTDETRIRNPSNGLTRLGAMLAALGQACGCLAMVGRRRMEWAWKRIAESDSSIVHENGSGLSGSHACPNAASNGTLGCLKFVENATPPTLPW
jgi:hypothetical protein